MFLYLKIKPGSKKNQLSKDTEGNWLLKVKAPPTEGNANDEVIRTLADILRISKSKIQIVSGHSIAHKKIFIDTNEEAEVLKRLKDKTK